MSADPFTGIKATLESLEQEQRERFRPQPKEEPRTPADSQRAQAQPYLDRLNASCSRSISIDAGWLQ